jgi:phage tail tape-measure protein
MAREFVMGAKLVLNDAFSGPIKQAARASQQFRNSVSESAHAAEQLRESAIGLKEALLGLAGIEIGKKAHEWLVGANADMEQYQNTLSVVMGSQEKAVETLQWATKFAAQTPFEIPQIVEATTRMQAYGISAQKTLGIVGDMASVMGKLLAPPSRNRRRKSGKIGGNVYLRRLPTAV